MSQNQSLNFESSEDPISNADQELLAEFGSLWAEADQLWEQYQHTPAFGGYVSADYNSVFKSLASLRGKVFSVLEWGSGLGVVTIMASRMGFETYGIEAESNLVEHSEDFALTYGPEAKFSLGSFFPDGFEWNPATGEEVNRTMIDVASGYDALEMELNDFDLIYAFPWPEEQLLFQNVIREFGHSEAMFLCYDAREGISLTRVHDC